MPIFDDSLWTKRSPQSKRVGPEESPAAHEGGGRALPPRARPLPCGPPVGSPVAIFCYMKSFVKGKIISNLSGRDSAATRRNLGGTNLGLRQSCSARDTSLREGEIITNAPLIRRGQSPSTSSPAPSPLKTPVHLLYPILYQNHKLVPVGC